MYRSFLRNLGYSLVWMLACSGTLQAKDCPGVSELPDFTELVQKNAASVVHVEAKYNGKSMSDRQGDDFLDDPQAQLFRRFFGMPMLPTPKDEQHISLGSGFIISKDGYILTNNHVVQGADSVTVRLQDRQRFKAKVIGTDAPYDIALLKINAGRALPAARICDRCDLKPGQWVIAIGSPFGLDYTVTKGIISAVGRSLGSQDQPYIPFIQTDVPINRGNSGGPLFNIHGQVIGINSQIYSNTGGYQGVAFSIPIHVVMGAVEQLKTKGYVTRGRLGVMVQIVTDEMAKSFHLTSDVGAAVTTVEPGSGAEKAGLHAGDVILSYNGTPIEQASDLPPLVAATSPGTMATLVIMRDGRKQTVSARIGETPHAKVAEGTTPQLAKSGAAALGFTVEELDKAARKQLKLKANEGVVINNIIGSVAAQAGLQPGDVILMVNQRHIGSVAEFQEMLQGIKPGSTVVLLVRHGKTAGFVSLTVPGK